MSEKIQIFLNSKTANSYNTESTSDCIFILPKIELKKRHKAYISVVHAVIPHSFYNVNETNNKLNYFLNDFPFIFNYSVTIPPANYNINTLISTITSLLEPGFTITYNSNTNKITMTHETYPWGFTFGTTCEELLGITTIFNLE